MRLIDLDSEYIQETLYRRGFKTRQDIERISFLGDQMECVKINQMVKDWLKQFDAEKEGADNG